MSIRSCVLFASLACCSFALAEEPFDFDVREIRIPMGDGGSLAADVYLPGEGKFPTVLTITMSSKQKCASMYYPRGDFYYSGNYALVCVERRGSFGSANNARRDGLNPDGQDGHDVVEWIAKQPWSDGKIGMWGASNQGKIQYATAMTNPRHLTCIMPAETRPETREYRSIGVPYDSAYPGGVLRLEMVENAVDDEEAKAGQPGTGGMANMARKHPLDDGFFSRRPKGAPTLADVKIPLMAVGSWFDNDINRATVRLFGRLLSETDAAVRKHHRLLIGPWTHTGVYRDGKQGQLEFTGASEVYRRREKEFFDHWLRGSGDGPRDVVSWYQMGEDQWRSADSFPPAGSTQVTFYLQPNSGLSSSKTSGSKGSAEFRGDPENLVPTVGGQNKQRQYGKGPWDQRAKVESHPDVLTYTSEPLSDDLAVAGDINFEAFVSSDAEDTDVAFRLTDVFPDGRSMLLRDGILRMSLRNGRKQYEFLKPGKAYRGTIETIPLAWTFLKGHRVRVIVSASNYPRYDLNTNTSDKSGEARVAHNRLYHGGERASALVMTTLAR